MARVLLGHATRSPRWDIPKGLAEQGEDFRSAAVRELHEETGLSAPPGVLRDIGVHRYLPGKDLALFAWLVAPLPEPTEMHCRSLVYPILGRPFPEFDRFGLFAWEAALPKVGRSRARVLAGWIGGASWGMNRAAGLAVERTASARETPMVSGFDLQRCVAAQNGVIDAVRCELRDGRKRTHWMWFVFPQVRGLGHSVMAQRHAIDSLAKAAGRMLDWVSKMQTAALAALTGLFVRPTGRTG